MTSQIIWTLSGTTIRKITTNSNKLYANGVASAEYGLISDSLQSGDVIIINCTIGGNTYSHRLKPQTIIMPDGTTMNGWKVVSNGDELRADVQNEPVEISFNFNIKRYSTLDATRIISDITTASDTLYLYSGDAYHPEVEATDAEEIMADLEDLEERTLALEDGKVDKVAGNYTIQNDETLGIKLKHDNGTNYQSVYVSSDRSGISAKSSEGERPESYVQTRASDITMQHVGANGYKTVTIDENGFKYNGKAIATEEYVDNAVETDFSEVNARLTDLEDGKVDKVVDNYEINNSADGIKIAYEDEYFKTGVTVTDWLNGGFKLYSSEKMEIAGGGSYWETIEIGVKDIATKSDAVGSIELSLNSTTYVLTVQAKNVNGENIGTAQTVDLPLESIVSSATYYNSYTYDGITYTKVIVITLSTTDVPTIVPVGDLVSGLQNEITSSNKLSADLVDDTNTTNKFVTTSEKNTWNAKQNALTSGSNITISGNTISATDTTYENKLAVQGGTDVSLVTTGEKYIWNGKQDTLTAGSNISISDNTISATDTTYSAGTGLTLSGTTFNVNTNVIETKPTEESYTIASNDWTALSSSDPYTYSATITATYTIGNDTEIGIVADQPVLFANYGFVVGAVSGQNVTIYALEQPETSVTLSVSYRG